MLGRPHFARQVERLADHPVTASWLQHVGGVPSSEVQESLESLCAAERVEGIHLVSGTDSDGVLTFSLVSDVEKERARLAEVSSSELYVVRRALASSARHMAFLVI